MGGVAGWLLVECRGGGGLWSFGSDLASGFFWGGGMFEVRWFDEMGSVCCGGYVHNELHLGIVWGFFDALGVCDSEI